MDINKRQFGGRQVVTCNTCHNGRPVPADMPVFPVLEPADRAEAGPADRRSDSGEVRRGARRRAGAAEGHRPRRSPGRSTFPPARAASSPMPAAVERYLKAPNLAVTIYETPTYAIAQGFDGTTAWAQDQAGRVTEPVKLDVGARGAGGGFLRAAEPEAGVRADHGRGHREGERPRRLPGGRRARRATSPNRCTSTRRRACCCGSRPSCRRRSATARSRWISTTIATPAAA